jgi:hypothetical protein
VAMLKNRRRKNYRKRVVRITIKRRGRPTYKHLTNIKSIMEDGTLGEGD